jgi:hypothetical protein
MIKEESAQDSDIFTASRRNRELIALRRFKAFIKTPEGRIYGRDDDATQVVKMEITATGVKESREYKDGTTDKFIDDRVRQKEEERRRLEALRLKKSSNDLHAWEAVFLNEIAGTALVHGAWPSTGERYVASSSSAFEKSQLPRDNPQLVEATREDLGPMSRSMRRIYNAELEMFEYELL